LAEQKSIAEKIMLIAKDRFNFRQSRPIGTEDGGFLIPKKKEFNYESIQDLLESKDPSIIDLNLEKDPVIQELLEEHQSIDKLFDARKRIEKDFDTFQPKSEGDHLLESDALVKADPQVRRTMSVNEAAERSRYFYDSPPDRKYDYNDEHILFRLAPDEINFSAGKDPKLSTTSMLENRNYNLLRKLRDTLGQVNEATGEVVKSGLHREYDDIPSNVNFNEFVDFANKNSVIKKFKNKFGDKGTYGHLAPKDRPTAEDIAKYNRAIKEKAKEYFKKNNLFGRRERVYEHYIPVGPRGEKAVNLIESIPVTHGDVNISRAHEGQYTPGATRKEYGGEVDSYQEGGEVTDPEDPFANALQSREPYRDDYMNKLLKYAEPGDDTYMRIEDAFADKFNTELTPIEKIHYKLWLEAGFGNPRDIGVYDIQGYWKSGQWKNNTDPDNHGTDTFKKPNHPTFSAESKYSKQKGGSEYIGGMWREDGGFMAGPHNFYDNEALMWEFNREPNRPEYLYMGLPAVTVNGSDK